MIPVDLVPEMVREAASVRFRARRILYVLIVAVVTIGMLIAARHTASWLWQDGVIHHQYNAEIEALAKSLAESRKLHGKKRELFERIKSMQRSRSLISQHLSDISGFIPLGLTLASLHVDLQYSEFLGVAKDRTVIRDFVSGLSLSKYNADVRIVKLGAASIEQYVVHDFIIRATQSLPGEVPSKTK